MSAAKRFIPLLDRVLVEKVKRDAKTAAGILLPDTASKMNEGVVIAVGPGRVAQDGKTISPQLKEGDKVLLPEFGGSSFKFNGKDLTLYSHEEILGKFE